MDFSPFVPALADLAITILQSTEKHQCIWRKKKLEGGVVTKCTRQVGNDAKINKLVTALAAIDKSSAPYYRTLKDIAERLLCAGNHREAFSDQVYKKWEAESKENDSLNAKDRETGIRTKMSTNSKIPSIHKPARNSGAQAKQERTTPSELQPTICQILDIYKEDSLHCHALTEKGPCKVVCDQKRLPDRNRALEDLANHHSISPTVEVLLRDLSALFFCLPFHENQAAIKYNEWIKEISASTATRLNETDMKIPRESLRTSIPETPPAAKWSDLDSGASTLRGDVDKSWDGQNSVSTLVPTPSEDESRHIKQSSSPLASKSIYNDDFLLKGEDEAEHESIGKPLVKRQLFKPSQKTESDHDITSNPFTGKSSTPFIAFTSKTQLEITKDLKFKIKSMISDEEKKTGFIYAYQRENTPYVKIGFSEDPKKRMKKIEKRCDYKPQEKFSHKMPNAMKVERLLQKYLWTYRRREPLVNRFGWSLCNEGRGCDKKHLEWFDITIERAEAAVLMWKRWIERAPYDERGVLKEAWSKHLQTYDVRLEEDRWNQWIDFQPVKDSVTDGKPRFEVKIEIARALPNSEATRALDSSVEKTGTKVEVKTEVTSSKAMRALDSSVKTIHTKVEAKTETVSTRTTRVLDSTVEIIETKAEIKSETTTSVYALPPIDTDKVTAHDKTSDIKIEEEDGSQALLKLPTSETIKTDSYDDRSLHDSSAVHVTVTEVSA